MNQDIEESANNIQGIKNNTQPWIQKQQPLTLRDIENLESKYN